MFRRVGKNHSLMDMRCAHRRSRSATASALCAAAIGFVGLSQRTAAQTWTGGAGEWNVASNWSNGLVPNSPTTDVWIDGGNSAASSSVKLVYALSSMDIHSLTIDEGDSLAHEGLLYVSGSVTVNGMLAVGRRFSLPSELIFTTPFSSISGVGDVRLNDTNAAILGAGLSIASGIRLHGNGAIYGSYGAQALTNDGTIVADTGQIQFRGDFINRGSMQAANGGWLRTGDQIAGDHWTNPGEFVVDDTSILELGGTFSATDIGVIKRQPHSRVNLSGRLDNTGHVLDLETTTGTLTISANTATIVGGTIMSSGGAQLLIDTSVGGILDGVTLETDMIFRNNAGLAMRHGLTLHDVVVDLGGGTNAANFTSFGSDGSGPQAISGTGEIRLGASPLNRIYGGGLTLGPGIYTHGGGKLAGVVNLGTVASDIPGKFMTMTDCTNAATVTVVMGSSLVFADSANTGSIAVADGASLTLAGKWKTTGSISLDGASKLLISGPFATPGLAGIVHGPGVTATIATTVANAGATLDAGAIAGTLVLQCATITGGMIAASGGSKVVVEPRDLTHFATVFDGVTLRASPTFTGVRTEIDVQNGLTLADVTVDLTGGATGSNDLAFTGTNSQTLGGTGRIVLGNAAMSAVLKNLSYVAVTLGQGIVIDTPTGTISGPFLNQGLIRAHSMVLTSVTNQGTLSVADHGNLSFLNSTDNVNRGLMQIDAGGRISLSNAKFIQAAGDLVVNGQLDSLGAVTISGGTVSGGGKVYGDIHIAPATGTIDGRPTVSISPGSTPDGLGSVGTLTFASYSGLTLTKGTQLIAELASDGTSDVLRLALAGNVNLTLEAGSSLDLLALAPLPMGVRYVVATYDGVLTGSFTDVSPGYDVSYATPHQIVVTVVPEPGGTLTALALATLCFARRRR